MSIIPLVRRRDTIDLLAIPAMIPLFPAEYSSLQKETPMNASRRGAIGLMIGAALGLGAAGAPVKEPLIFAAAISFERVKK